MKTAPKKTDDPVANGYRSVPMPPPSCGNVLEWLEEIVKGQGKGFGFGVGWCNWTCSRRMSTIWMSTIWTDIFEILEKAHPRSIDAPRPRWRFWDLGAILPAAIWQHRPQEKNR